MNTNYGDDQGIVFQKDRGQFSVQSNGRRIACSLSSRLHTALTGLASGPSSAQRATRIGQEIDRPDLVAIGDLVRFVNTGENRGVITEILGRRNQLSRRSAHPGERALEQLIVANADQVVPVFAACNPAPKWGLLDRYLVAAEAAGLPALVCITKIDLATRAVGLEATLADYRRIGYKVQLASAVTGEGLDEIEQSLRDRVSVLVGKSGVGKSSLLNAIQPDLGLRVQEVGRGKKGKGLHTTSRPEMFQLEKGGAVVDTPGIREFGLWDLDDRDLALYFPEMRRLVGSCRFGLDCRHDEEPGCAIRKAVMRGEISPYRYQSYLKLRARP